MMTLRAWAACFSGGCLLIGGSLQTQALEITLFEYALNHNGVISAVLPAGSSFDTATGLGTVQMRFSGAGSHFGLLYVDHELSEVVNTFFNELGEVSAAPPPAGMSWEIDEPGFIFGDIYDNFLLGSLDNTIGSLGPEDVSMALGWQFDLAVDETAVLTFLLSTSQPEGGFYLRQFDPDSGENVYFTSTLRISGGGVVVPDPASPWWMLGMAALALLAVRPTAQRKTG